MHQHLPHQREHVPVDTTQYLQHFTHYASCALPFQRVSANCYSHAMPKLTKHRFKQLTLKAFVSDPVLNIYDGLKGIIKLENVT